MRPTQEQLMAVEKFRSGRPLKIAAFAGAGKTTTLRLLAESRKARGIYLAFNKSIANEAKEKFPKSVDCRTTHSIAFRSVMPRYGSMPKMTKGLHAKQLAAVLDLKPLAFKGALRLNGVHQAHLMLGTVKRFCQSPDALIALAHVPSYGRLLGAREEVVAEVRGWAVEQARRLWGRMTDRADDLPLGHDGYLKVWALEEPELPADYILLDEAQDTNGVVLGVLNAQRAQTVYVGDRHQQIYEWRGAINAMELIRDCDEAALTQSFRFGDGIADAASGVLATMGEDRRILGNPSVKSTITGAGIARTVLARTNATVILEVLEAANENRKPCVVGGTDELKRLLSDVYELKAGKPGVCPEFFGFQHWREVVEFADSEEGEPIRRFVQLVEQHGENKLWAAVKTAQDDEAGADIILSTAHKAKGREWDSVRLASDFGSSRLGSHPDAASEVRLFYVAMTRAKNLLIVDPEILRTFTTNAWKTKQPTDARPRQKATAAALRQAPAVPAAAPPVSPPSQAWTPSRVELAREPQQHQPATMPVRPSRDTVSPVAEARTIIVGAAERQRTAKANDAPHARHPYRFGAAELADNTEDTSSRELATRRKGGLLRTVGRLLGW